MTNNKIPRNKGKRRKRKVRIGFLAGAVACMSVLLIVLVWIIGFFLYPHSLLQNGSLQEKEHEQVMEQIEQEDKTASIKASQPGSIVDTSYLNTEEVRSCFYSLPIEEGLLQTMQPNLYDANQDFVRPEDLRDIRVLYTGFDGQTHIGQLIANQLIAQDLEEIFYELYQQQYPIENISIAADCTDDEQSMSQDLTRSLALTRDENGQPQKHEHSLGLAVDFNPLYNPQVIVQEDGSSIVLPATAGENAVRSEEMPYQIDENDPAYQAFTRHGFLWGGTWPGRNDYQHFEKYFNYDTGDIDLSIHS